MSTSTTSGGKMEAASSVPVERGDDCSLSAIPLRSMPPHSFDEPTKEDNTMMSVVDAQIIDEVLGREGGTAAQIYEPESPRRSSLSNWRSSQTQDSNNSYTDDLDSPWVPKRNSDKCVLVYPITGFRAINITIGDLERLKPGQFLNDTLVELGLKFLMHDLRETNPALADKVHVFSPFFYKKLNEKNPQNAFKTLRKWTSKVDIFEKKYLIVPINERIHWYLALIIHPEHILQHPRTRDSSSPRSLKGNEDHPTADNNSEDEDIDMDDNLQLSPKFESKKRLRRACVHVGVGLPGEEDKYNNISRIFILDSLNKKRPKVCPLLNQYLEMEAKDKKGIENVRKLQGNHAAVPTQPNFCDCGLYLLHFARTFLSNPEDYSRHIRVENGKQRNYEQRTVDWKGDSVAGKRDEFAERIRSESKEWKAHRAKELVTSLDAASISFEGEDDDIQTITDFSGTP